MNIEIVKQIDESTKWVWRFCFLDGHLYLDDYSVYSKQTKRQKWKLYQRYQRSFRCNLKESEVPLPEQVRDEALQKFIQSVEVLKWSERNSPY